MLQGREGGMEDGHAGVLAQVDGKGRFNDCIYLIPSRSIKNKY